ncbi:MAG: LAGLIDADG family homing endonuclease [Anaerolineae bacterium]|nr:LAGLIDADG family homing endonuclease [Anaerolineae bacterium]
MQKTKRNALHELGYKIFLDRYAQKDMTRTTLKVGDTVIVVVDSKTGQREIGTVTALNLPQVTVQLRDGEVVQRDLEHVDKPLETEPEQMMDRVAAGIAEVEATPEKRREWTERFRWLLDDWKFVPGGRILTGAGTDQKLTYYNCYVLPSPHDSRQGIMTTLMQMTEIMSRGGGVGINISSLRPRHAYVKGVNGRSSGSVSWGALYSFVTGLIEQGGSRRGALMLILNDWHPDVFNFVNSKRQAGQITNANISVGISDTFMEAVRTDGDWDLVFPDTSDPRYDAEWNGDIDAWRASGGKIVHYRTIKARELWHSIIESAWASAEPGMWFRERSNKMSNSWYFNPLICTNPCVTGDTRIHTNKGLIQARDLFEDETQFEVVIDGRFGLEKTTMPATRVFMTGVKPVFRLTTCEGYSIRATADHRFMTPRGWVELQHLRPGDKLHILNRKGGFGSYGSLDEGRLLGWMVGNGTMKEDCGVLMFFGEEKRELAPLFVECVNELVEPLTQRANRSYPVKAHVIEDHDEDRIASTRLRAWMEQRGLTEGKLQVPEAVFQGTEDMQRGFLQALFTADGSVQYHASNQTASIRLSSSHLPLLEQVQVLLSNFGIASRIHKYRREAQLRMMPDGKGGKKEYLTQAQHELAITRANMHLFQREIGFLAERKNKALSDVLTYKDGPRAESFLVEVERIEAQGSEEVFDLTEEVTHSLVANSFVIHNCGEQSLGSYSVCNLGAINLAKFYDPEADDVAWDELIRATKYGVRFLDNVIDSTPYFFEENRIVQLGERRIGLGTMGVAELMIRCGVRYGSDESVAFIDKLYKTIALAAYEASIDLAAEKGPFPKCEPEKLLQSGYMQQMPDYIREGVRQKGLRNVTLLTQAPTGTTGTMVNTSTGIEPFFSWVYYRKSRLGLHEEQVPVVREWYEQNPNADKLPHFFVTAMEMTPEEHVKVQAAFQKWVDSSISKTANVPNHYTIEQVGELYMMMYDLGCKGGTIYRDGSRDEQVLMLKGDERAEKEKKALEEKLKAETAAPASTPHHVYPRPTKLSGTTVSFKTPFGTAYITMNSDDQGNPFEVFITVGKAGSDVQADAEGLGRLISLQLRATAPHNRREMLKLIVEQLQNIGGARPMGFGAQRVASLPDAVAQALQSHYLNDDAPQQLGLPLVASLPVSTPKTPQTKASSIVDEKQRGYASGADICPVCGTVSFIRAEGCRKCEACGYTEC